MRTRLSPRLALAVVVLAACGEVAAPPEAGLQADAPAFSRSDVTPVPTAPTPARVAALVEAVNARFAELGSSARLNDVWLFTVGAGTDPYRRLRTGSRWMWSPVAYYLDEADFTAQLDPAAVAATLESAYERWNQVPAADIRAERLDATLGNVDIFDGWFDDPGTAATCDDILDLTAEVWTPDYSAFYPAADAVVGGWLSGDWFSECLGSGNIIGVTFSLSYGDANADHYADRLYVEQFYNDAFDWVLDGAQFLSGEMDLESIAVHENGHTLGLGHYGGAGKVPEGLWHSWNFDMIFSPQAIMNPGYLGGEKRDLYSIDRAALRSLY